MHAVCAQWQDTPRKVAMHCVTKFMQEDEIKHRIEDPSMSHP